MTKRRMSKKTLRQNEEMTMVLLNANDDAELLIDIEGNIITLNRAYANKFGRQPNELVGLCVYDLFPYDIAERLRLYIKKAIDTGETIRFQDEWQGLHFESSVHPIFDDQRKVKNLAINIHDITEKYEKEKELLDYQTRLRDLASQLSMVEERERRRIANDLHDSIGQNLTFCKIKLEILHKSLYPRFADSLEQLIELIDTVIHNIRTLIFDLSPPMLYELGLAATIKQITNKLEEQYHISVYFEGDKKAEPLSDEVSITAYRAVSEILTNIAKHAHADSVKVSIWQEGKYAYISVIDNGVGFDVSIPKGQGLFNIREKLEHIGGCIEIKSELGHGTNVLLSFPLSQYPSPHFSEELSKKET